MARGTITYRLRPDGPPAPDRGGRLAGTGADALLEEVRRAGAREVPLFGPAALDLSRRMRKSFPERAPDLSRYRRIEPGPATADDLTGLVKRLDPALGKVADARYVSPSPNPAWWWPWPWWQWLPWWPRTECLEAWQTYLEPSCSGGIGARRAWRAPGGNGAGVRVADVEESWHPWHEDLPGVRLCGSAPTGGWASRDWRHGTAVLGMLGARLDAHGMTGICHGAQLLFASVCQPAWTDPNEADAIARAADALQPGDVLLIEEEKLHPTLQQGGAVRLPVEWWPENRDAILTATLKGVLVVEPAGNSSYDLDDQALDTPLSDFGGDWKNPLRRAPGHDTGAVIVGGGVPPPRWKVGPPTVDPRSREPLSNYGSCVDAQGWGSSVATCGGSGEFESSGDRRSYTRMFSGTSAASAMVAGVLACAQGMLRAAGDPNDPELTPATARLKLQGSSPVQTNGAPGQVGPLPDLDEWIPPSVYLSS